MRLKRGKIQLISFCGLRHTHAKRRVNIVVECKEHSKTFYSLDAQSLDTLASRVSPYMVVSSAFLDHLAIYKYFLIVLVV